jgi:hypothetical protein
MAWLAGGYSKRKPITITGGASGAQTDFQLKLNAVYAAAMQSDFDDLRFTQANGTTLIDAWLESKVNDDSAMVWAEFPTTPANTVEQTYYMYYGNAGAASDWDIEATFLLGDNLNDNSIDAGKWNETENLNILVDETGGELKISGTSNGNGSVNDSACSRIRSVDSFGDIALDCRVKRVSGSYYGAMLQLYYNSTNYVSYGLWKWTGPVDDDMGLYNAGVWYNADSNFDNTATDASWHDYSFRRVGTSLELYRDGNLKTSKTYPGISTHDVKVGVCAFARVSGNTVGAIRRSDLNDTLSR